VYLRLGWISCAMQDRRSRRGAAALLALLLVEQSDAAARSSKRSGGCHVTSVWPDGTELVRECIVEGEGRHSSQMDFRFLKNTRWLWNDWREVIFTADGDFLAPAEGCEEQGNPRCKWYSEGGYVYVNFGGAGVHKLQADGEKATLYGSRESDGDKVRATRQ